MSYSDLYLKNRRHGSLGMIAVGVLVIFGFFLYFSEPSLFPSSLPSRALSKQLSNHELVNASQHQIGIYWQSPEPETGWVVFGTSPNSLSRTALDERDVGDKKNTFVNHYVLLKGLKEKTQYFYKIVSGDQVVVSAGNRPFSFITPKNTGAATSLKPAYGKVLQTNGEPAHNAIVIIRYRNIIPLLTLTKVTGEWLIPLQFAVDKTSFEPIMIAEADTAKIEVKSDKGNAEVDTLVKNMIPLPQSIVLGQNYKFLQEENVLPAATAKESEQKEYTISILLPKENALIPGSKPLLKGLGIPGKQVKIQINSQPGYISRVMPDKKGEWNINVPVSFPAGSYVMTLTTEDKTGQVVSLTRSFSLAKSGQQVLGESTPSGTIVPTATPIASLSATLSPTQIATPTATITLPLFTATPVSTGPSVITPTALLSSGALDSNPVIFGGLGLIVAGIGFLLAF